jgi:uncharacterized protein
MQCPICKKSVQEPAADTPSAFPFCSDRCKLIDLGRWLDGRYQIPVEEEDDLPDDPPPRRPDSEDEDPFP